MNKGKNIAGLAAVLGLVCGTPALADSITLDPSQIGNSFTFNYNGFVNGTPVNGLTGQTTLTLTGVNGNDYTFDYSVANTSSSPVTGSRISSFAFNTDPNITGAASTGTFGYTTLNSNYPNGIGNVDVCFKGAQTGSCAGGGSGGIDLGQTGSGSLTLSFSQPVTSLTLSDFFVRYQSISGIPGVSSASGAGTLSSSGGTTSTSGGTVPEPGMLGLFAGGLFALAYIRRRRRGADERQPEYMFA